MRTKSKNPKKQRYYQFNISNHESHKIMSANLSADIRSRKGFRSLPIRIGDTVRITRGSMKGRSGKVMKVEVNRQRVFVDKVVKRKTDNTEIPVPIHPSNLVITKYQEKDRSRMELINRRIKDVEEKIDIEAVLAESEAEEEDIIDFDDEDLPDDSETENPDLELIEETNEGEETLAEEETVEAEETEEEDE